MNTTGRKIHVPESSLPLPVGQRNWSQIVLSSVCTSTGVATWSFVIGGSAAIYLDAKMGMIAMIAGALIGQLLVTLATVPHSTKYGIETTMSTKPQLGVRGSVIGLGLLLFTSIGWNTVLMIFFGNAVAAVLTVFGVIDESARGTVSIVASVIGLSVLALLVTRGVRTLAKTGPWVALGIFILTIWLVIVLFQEFGATAIFNASPSDPADDLAVNYTSVVEMLIAGTFGWWGYMGGMVRMVNSARKTILPTMLGLGLAWALIASVSLFGALMTGEPDPTIWAPEVAGPVSAVFVLLFIALANLGSTLVGIFVSTLAIKQMPGLGHRVRWNTVVALIATPMLLCLLFFPTYIFDNVPVFMAYLGMLLGPMIGVQIADWFIIRRPLSVSSLYDVTSKSKYWYFGGFNVSGLVALLLGTLTYLSILNPNTYVPNVAFFPYTTATIPAVLVAALVYVIGMRMTQRMGTPAALTARARKRSTSQSASAE